MYVIKNVDIKSFAKVCSLFITSFSLIPWLFTGIAWIFASRFLRYISGSYNTSRVFNNFVLPIIIWLCIPLAIALLSFLVGLLFGWFYNLITKKIGGLKVNIVLEKESIDQK